MTLASSRPASADFPPILTWAPVLLGLAVMYGLYACNGILFNHESPVRGETFVTRKITRALARIKLGLQDSLYLGNMDAKRDWGHAKDYVEERGYWDNRHSGAGRNPVPSDAPIVAVDPRYFRPTEVETLLGDPSKAKEKLGWTPKISFDELVKKHGYKTMDYNE